VAQQPDLLPTRETLLSRLRDLDDNSSWREFFDLYWKLVFNLARKTGLSEAAAQDIVQETFIALSKQLPEFRYDRGRGSFKSWMLQITRSKIVDAIRRAHYKHQDQRLPREEALTPSLLENQGPTAPALDSLWEAEWRAHLLETAMARLKEVADARQFQMFYLHVMKNIPALKVARRFEAKLPEVYFAKYKLSARLKKEILRLESGAS
jgi:RNA polymerase sigma factor (sigma-70 family)